MKLSNSSKIIIIILKIIVTALILYFIFKKIQFDQLIADFLNIKLWVILLIVISTVIKLLIQAYNWGKYLKLNSDYTPKKYEVLKSYFVGLALRFVGPGGIGVVGKIYFVNNKKRATLASIGVERIFLTWKNLFFAAFAAIFYFSNINMIIKVTVFIAVIFLPFIIYLFSFFTKNENIHSYLLNYLKRTPEIMLAQIIFVLITFYQYFILLRNFVDISFFKIMISVPLIHISHIIPLSFNGFGLRETFAIEVFSKYGISPELAVTATFLIFFFNSVVPALIGVYYIIRIKHNKETIKFEN
ncbi:MAG: flippase-like domain-containing protein [Candidatus Cloacimonetes bacterium]|nr:flippase-like domain-containing protein [Candidatus Cloacimonadota bacterium]